MSFSGEDHHFESSSISKDAWLIETDIEEVIDRYADHFVTLSDGNGDEDSPAEILLGGRVEGEEYGTFTDISLIILKVGEISTATICVDKQHYEISESGIRYANNPFRAVDKVDFDEIRCWLSPSNDSWHKSHSQRIASSMQELDGLSA